MNTICELSLMCQFILLNQKGRQDFTAFLISQIDIILLLFQTEHLAFILII